MRLSYDIVDRFKELTGDEIDFILHVAQFQDRHTVVTGIDWRSVCGSIGISKSNFYKIIHSLENKKFIEVVRNESGKWTFKILDNETVWRDEN